MIFFKKIFIFIKGVFIIMSKFAQSFSRYRPVFKLDEKTNVLKLTDEKVDVQEEINSYYDDSLYRRLEAYFESGARHVQVGEEIADDYDGYGNDADEVLDIMESVSGLRQRYNLSEDLYSISDVLNFVRGKAQSSQLAQPAQPNELEGGDDDETSSETNSDQTC